VKAGEVSRGVPAAVSEVRRDMAQALHAQDALDFHCEPLHAEEAAGDAKGSEAVPEVLLRDLVLDAYVRNKTFLELFRPPNCTSRRSSRSTSPLDFTEISVGK
jgi:hypothetical protein